MPEKELDPRSFEVGALLGVRVDPDYLAAWAPSRLGGLLEQHPGAAAEDIANLALELIPDRFCVALKGSGGSDVYERMRREVEARREGVRQRTSAAERLGHGRGR